MVCSYVPGIAGVGRRPLSLEAGAMFGVCMHGRQYHRRRDLKGFQILKNRPPFFGAELIRKIMPGRALAPLLRVKPSSPEH